jgi:acyl-homoserine lactone acylase PvdQ
LPRRAKDGLFVRDAHDPDAQWNGYLDFAENPKISSPDAGVVVSANSVTDPANFAPIATRTHFEPRHRQDRIEAVLGSRSDHTAATMSALHADVVADYAPALRDALVALTNGVAADSLAARAREALAAWDGCFDVDSVGAPIFFFVQQRLLPLVFVPLLGAHVGRRFATGRRGLPRLQKLLVDAADPLRAAIEGSAGRTLSAMALEALEAACTRIAHGCDTSDVARWRWGTIQRARLGGLLAHIPGIGNRLLAHNGPYPGDDYTVNPNRGLDDGKQLRVLVTGTSRFVCDLSKPDEATFMHSSGLRSDLGSLWHANLCGPWTRFETFRSALWKPDEIPDVVERLVIGGV